MRNTQEASEVLEYQIKLCISIHTSLEGATTTNLGTEMPNKQITKRLQVLDEVERVKTKEKLCKFIPFSLREK